MRHSSAHLLASSVVKIFPGTKVAIGPVIENGFYYDFDFKKPISESDLPKIEKEMKKLQRENYEFKQEWINVDAACDLFKNEPYKLEIISEIARGERDDFGQKGKVSIYKSGDFVDLCKGPHVAKNSEIGFFKLLSLAGAYWKGSEKNKMLTRIYGICFETKEELDKYIWQVEEAKKRDHRKLGKSLDLFIIDDNIGRGLPLLTPKGTIIKDRILEYESQIELQAGFQRVSTPHIGRSEIYKKTGHWQHYRETMYAPFGIEGDEYVLKPMNCPHHYMIYSSKPRSYKDLPVRLSEPGTCYRFEKSGELSGLLRVRALTIDDAHILMTEEQVESEFKLCIEMVAKMFAAFKLDDYYVRLSLSDPSDAVKYIADPKIWQRGGELLEKIVRNNKLKYTTVSGEASFYGPKLDYIVKDSLGREWQMSTLQLDLFMGKRLNLTYTDEKGKKQHPIILHRGLTGSLERTLAILIEHFGGAFPLWLAPVQLAILPISQRHVQYGRELQSLFMEAHIRPELDERSETIGAKIREAALQKIPYLAIIGDRERENKSVSARTRVGKDLGKMDLRKFIALLNNEIDKKI